LSILKSLQDYLQGYTGIEEIQKIATYTTDEKSGYALGVSSTNKVSEDVLGNKIFLNNYLLLAKEVALDEGDRQGKQDFLEDFSDWLDEQNSKEKFPALSGKFKVIEIAVANAMLYDISEDGTGIYQVQIFLKIKKEVEKDE
jgi:hypothetical protein